MKTKNFKTYNENPDIDVNGTSLVGEITADYQTLKKHFGQPSDSDGYKSDAEWIVQFDSGEVATIYNWKDGKNYCGKSGTPKTKITDWHIGGHNEKVMEFIQNVLNS